METNLANKLVLLAVVTSLGFGAYNDITGGSAEQKWKGSKANATNIVTASSNAFRLQEEYAIYKNSTGQVYRIDRFIHGFASPRGVQPNIFETYNLGDSEFEDVLSQCEM